MIHVQVGTGNYGYLDTLSQYKQASFYVWLCRCKCRCAHLPVWCTTWRPGGCVTLTFVLVLVRARASMLVEVEKLTRGCIPPMSMPMSRPVPHPSFNLLWLTEHHHLAYTCIFSSPSHGRGGWGGLWGGLLSGYVSTILMYCDVSCVYPEGYMYLSCILMYPKCILNALLHSKRIHVS
jgi:hypothetical protein